MTFASGKVIQVNPNLSSVDAGGTSQKVDKEQEIKQGSDVGRDAARVATLSGAGAAIGGWTDHSWNGAVDSRWRWRRCWPRGCNADPRPGSDSPPGLNHRRRLRPGCASQLVYKLARRGARWGSSMGDNPLSVHWRERPASRSERGRASAIRFSSAHSARRATRVLIRQASGRVLKAVRVVRRGQDPFVRADLASNRGLVSFANMSSPIREVLITPGGSIERTPPPRAVRRIGRSAVWQLGGPQNHVTRPAAICFAFQLFNPGLKKSKSSRRA